MKLLAHRHWITLSLFGKKLRLCARCTGIVLGFAVLKLTSTLFLGSFTLSPTSGLSLALLLALPSIIDWMTHRLNLRYSNNRVRFTTGFLEGSGVGLLSLTQISSLLRIFIIALISSSVIIIGNSKSLLLNK